MVKYDLYFTKVMNGDFGPTAQYVGLVYPYGKHDLQKPHASSTYQRQCLHFHTVVVRLMSWFVSV